MPKHTSEVVRQSVFQHVADAHVRDEKLSVDALLGYLFEEFGDPMPVGRTKIWQLRKEALEQLNNVVRPDPLWNPSPEEWSPEAYPFLLALNRVCVLGVDRSQNSLLGVPESSQLTAREATWGAKLYSVLKDAPVEIAYGVVTSFASRETVKEAYNQPIFLDDLIGFLEYKPWESPGATETYELACRLGRVPRIGNLEAPTTQVSKEVVIPNSTTLGDAVAWVESQLSVQENQTRQVLLALVERTEMVKQVAIQKINALWESRSDLSGSDQEEE